MLRYLLIEENKFSAQGELKSYDDKRRKAFMQDSIDTVRKVRLKGDDNTYLILSYEVSREEPLSVKDKYTLMGRKEKEDKLFDEKGIIDFLKINEVLTEDILIPAKDDG